MERVLESAPAGRRADENDDDLPGSAPAAPLDGDTVEFTEQMKGFLALGETDPVVGWKRARLVNQRFMFELTITVPDVERFLADDLHPGTADGLRALRGVGREAAR